MKDPWYSDTRPGNPPWAGHSSQPGHSSRTARKTAGSVLAAVVIGAVAAVLWTGVHPLQAGAQNPASAAAAPPQAPPPAAVPAADAQTYLQTTPTGTPIHWPCGTEIHVKLLGPAPAGAEQLLHDAVATLAGLSGLRLNTGTTTAGDENSINVRYQPTLPGNEAADVVGLGGATWSSPSGRITHGDVWIKNTSPDNTPGTPYAREVMLHELMHALGIKHAPDGSTEIMAPVLPPGPPLEPGPRDKASLNAAGCPHP